MRNIHLQNLGVFSLLFFFICNYQLSRVAGNIIQKVKQTKKTSKEILVKRMSWTPRV